MTLFIDPNVNTYTCITTTEDTESTEGLFPYFLYSVYSVLSVVKLSLEVGEGIWVIDYSLFVRHICSFLFLYIFCVVRGAKN